jgi:ribosomal protein L31
MEYKIVSGGSPSELTTKVNERIKDGWEIVGSHQVVIHREQNRYSGQQHMDTLNQLEYSQTMVYKNKNTIEVDISYYHPDDNEEEKVYDFEGMVEEFENKLSQLDDSVVVMCSVETN